MIIDTIPQLKKLSNTEKLLLINELWDSLSLQEDALPVPEAHKKILDERLRDHEANPEQGSAWKEVTFRILKKKGCQ
ncbi:MAG: addiction module protein [Candidatus Jettenia caeni]|nr:MAG: addiction module protein [Candidatus Jettenia caeni]